MMREGMPPMSTEDRVLVPVTVALFVSVFSLLALIAL
jgi:hypothetical protein